MAKAYASSPETVKTQAIMLRYSPSRHQLDFVSNDEGEKTLRPFRVQRTISEFDRRARSLGGRDLLNRGGC